MGCRRISDKPLSEPMMVYFTDAHMRHPASMRWTSLWQCSTDIHQNLMATITRFQKSITYWWLGCTTEASAVVPRWRCLIYVLNYQSVVETLAIRPRFRRIWSSGVFIASDWGPSWFRIRIIAYRSSNKWLIMIVKGFDGALITNHYHFDSHDWHQLAEMSFG